MVLEELEAEGLVVWLALYDEKKAHDFSSISIGFRGIPTRHRRQKKELTKQKKINKNS